MIQESSACLSRYQYNETLVADYYSEAIDNIVFWMQHLQYY